jgi:hypothetical protein
LRPSRARWDGQVGERQRRARADAGHRTSLRDTVVAGNGGVLGGARSAQHLHTSAVVRIANLADRGDYIGAGRA